MIVDKTYKSYLQELLISSISESAWISNSEFRNCGVSKSSSSYRSSNNFRVVGGGSVGFIKEAEGCHLDVQLDSLSFNIQSNELTLILAELAKKYRRLSLESVNEPTVKDCTRNCIYQKLLCQGLPITRERYKAIEIRFYTELSNKIFNLKCDLKN